jgi:hypothetical protein
LCIITIRVTVCILLSFSVLTGGLSVAQQPSFNGLKADHRGNGHSATISFSVSGGFHSAAFSLIITSSDPEAEIRYTTDGVAPTSTSLLYDAPLAMSNALTSDANIHQTQVSPPGHYYPSNPALVPKAIVIRAAAFDSEGVRISNVVTHSYFIHGLIPDHGNLPVLSINVELESLFDQDSGIFVPGVHWDETNPDWTGNYHQRGGEWEREIHVEFYENNTNAGFRQRAGLRTHGGNSRRYAQKGLRLYAKSEYGTSRFNHPLFPEKPISSYKRLVLKPFMSSWSGAGIEDFISNRIALTTAADALGVRPAIVYINGEYWGIYLLQERIDNRFVQDNHGIHPNNVDLIESWWGAIAEGSNDDYFQLYDFIDLNDLSNSANYQIIEDWIDLDNFIDYQLFEIFSANYDWPANNMKCWRDRGPGGKWRWIFYDGDAALQTCEFQGFEHALSTSYQDWPTNAQATMFLRKLMENPVFEDRFFDRLETLLNNEFASLTTTPVHQEVMMAVEGEIPRQIARFAYPDSLALWTEKMNSCLELLACRPCEVVDQVASQFGRSLVVSNCIIGMEESAHKGLQLHPNPNSGAFRVNFQSQTSEQVAVRILDVTGRQLASFQRQTSAGNNVMDMELSDLPSGILLLTVQGGSGVHAARFIKQ